MEDTFDRILDPSSSSSSKRRKEQQQQPEFLPSASYVGSKAGYVFRTSELGTGYHLDLITPYKNESSTTAVSVATEDVSNGVAKGKTAEELLEEAEKAALTSPSTTATLDPMGVSQMSAALSKAYERNQLQRSEFFDEPEKYMNSEVDLHDTLKTIQNIAAAPTLYKYLYGKQPTPSSLLAPQQQQGAIRILLQCFTHPNIDIHVVLIQTWNELLDMDLISLERDEEQRRIVQDSIGLLAYSLLGNQGIETLCSTLAQLESIQYDDTNNYKQGVEGILNLMETLLELDALGLFRDIYLSKESGGDASGQSPYLTVVHRIWEYTPSFISWLLHQVVNDEERCFGLSNNAGKDSYAIDRQQILLSSSDLLATIFQHEDGVPFLSKLTAMPSPESVTDISNGYDDINRAMNKKSDLKGPRRTVDGIDTLLRSVAPYRKRDPLDETECEYLENIFDALAATLLHGGETVVESFVNLQGIELMLRFLFFNGHAGSGALKVLNFCLSGPELSDDSLLTHANMTDSTSPLRLKENINGLVEMACAHFVDAGGLKLLFPLLMGTSIPKPASCTDAGKIIPSTVTSKMNKQMLAKKQKAVKIAKKEWAYQVRVNVIYILYALTRYLRDNSPYDAKPRLLAKLAESDCVSVAICSNHALSIFAD